MARYAAYSHDVYTVHSDVTRLRAISYMRLTRDFTVIIQTSLPIYTF
jgi:hypothetical protein